MSEIKIGTVQAILNPDRTARAADSLRRQKSDGKKTGSPTDASGERVKIDRSRTAFSKLQAVISSLDMAAINIRVADRTMEAIGDYIEQMKTQLQRIIKNYPPFPPDSEDRIKILRSFNTFRRQIDQLTIPPNDEGARKIMADPRVTPEAGDWEAIVGNNRFHKTIRSQEVHTGITGLNIQGLPETADDAEIKSAIVNLDSAWDTLRQRRSGLAADAAAIIRSNGYNAKITRLHQDYAEEMKYADMTEASAQYKSAEIKYELTIGSTITLTRTQPEILQLLV